MRIVPEVGSLRRRAMYKAMRAASITAALREWFRIVHISLQRTHVHMIMIDAMPLRARGACPALDRSGMRSAPSAITGQVAAVVDDRDTPRAIDRETHAVGLVLVDRARPGR
jgi:hypothetical protein